ncbi:outer membrane protein assembly factor BamD [Corallococcus praedator]|uniref:Outer membrane protein assembly factor BamD n=1 Tax=Corallococcus praedator TaxID=2316724 RepID=A0ABX9QK02_9BACT|nr:MULTISPECIES: outer membrane protein assembly factor BamD [Corallococcus]RKH17448.1 outer membrane protein assembly factor BamD [Corallococcus sp. CA047B]RKH30705.1 outer membrane protein assembly factor BamD [Corallococcus sp. CA031C]RKI10096.1 outer membrane protein assembly factor BamD [Corallococcus praedator]
MRSVVLCVTVLLLSGCAALSQGPAGEPNYAGQAAENLALGDAAMEDKDFLKAEKYYDHVRAKYPYLEAAREAELKLGDLDFAREMFPEAREKFDSFMKLHPTHPKVDYAAYRAALSYVEEFPSEFFALPPSYEKEQKPMYDALRAMNAFLRLYPESQYAKDAKVHADDARERLARHELYVASFYAKRERWKAVAQRLEGLLKDYPGTPLEEEALFDLHNAYVKLNEPQRAQDTLREVIKRLPGTPAAARAQKMLGS